MEEKRVRIRIKGANFLYKMVRNIVGTLAYVDNNKLLPDQIPTIIHSQNRILAGVTAPLHGLFHHRVFYQ
jgi:tRNA pseudouridine38-40 synthase